MDDNGFLSLVNDINKKKSKKKIGVDKGLAQIGDALVNLTYSMAKSLYLTKINPNHHIIRSGEKVNKKILANALKNADMKEFAKTRADAHDLADTVEAIIAYVWLNHNLTINEIITFLANHLSGDLLKRNQEIESAIKVFTELLISMKKYLPNE